MKLGDAISSVATPIARALKMPCIDPETRQLRPESGCAKMRNNLNTGMSLQDAIYERWFKAKQEGEKMKYQFTIVVEADTYTKASEKAESVGEIMAGQVRPVAPQRPSNVQPVVHTNIQTNPN